MRSLLVSFLILLSALVGSTIAINRVSDERIAAKNDERRGLLFPSSVLKIIALEHRGLLSDFLFSRFQTYYGGKLIRQEHLSDEDWDWIYQNAQAATDMDPYFLDPYYLGSANLAWVGRLTEANELLTKAMRYRTWDWTIPFYLGFNYFYFLNDSEKAAEYLMEAAKRPGGSGGLVPNLAARLAYKGKQTENAVIFMEEIMKKTDDPATRFVYELRLNALKRILYLEKAADLYKKKFGRYPQDLNQLVAKKIIKEIPVDPYQGEFYIETDGSIKTTSDLKPMWAK